MKIYKPITPNDRFLVQFYVIERDNSAKSNSMQFIDTDFDSVLQAIRSVIQDLPPCNEVERETVRVSIRHYRTGQKKTVKTKGFSFKKSNLKSSFDYITNHFNSKL